jgi:hypothetical protein
MIARNSLEEDLQGDLGPTWVVELDMMINDRGWMY